MKFPFINQMEDRMDRFTLFRRQAFTLVELLVGHCRYRHLGVSSVRCRLRRLPAAVIRWEEILGRLG